MTWSRYWVGEYSFATNLDSSWRSMAIEICRKIARFSCLFAPSNSHIITKHKSWVFQSLESVNCSLLIPFPCSSCTSSSFHHYVGIFSDFTCGSSADLHEAFRQPTNQQAWKKTRETFRCLTGPYYIGAMMICSDSNWTAISPICPHIGEFELQEWQSWPSRETQCHIAWHNYVQILT